MEARRRNIIEAEKKIVVANSDLWSKEALKYWSEWINLEKSSTKAAASVEYTTDEISFTTSMICEDVLARVFFEAHLLGFDVICDKDTLSVRDPILQNIFRKGEIDADQSFRSTSLCCERCHKAENMPK